MNAPKFRPVDANTTCYHPNAIVASLKYQGYLPAMLSSCQVQLDPGEGFLKVKVIYRACGGISWPKRLATIV